MRLRRPRVGLALGGGGARGITHLGVLKVLDQEKIPVDVVAGTSIGALIGAVYATGISAEEIERRVAEYLQSPEFQSSALRAFEAANEQGVLRLRQKIHHYLKNRFYAVQAMFKAGILSNEDFQATINHFVPDIRVEDTIIPFRAVATDLKSGEQYVSCSGSLRDAVFASCAVPGAIAPFREGERLLSDGGIICLVPTSVARREGADVVIAVAVDRHLCSDEELRNVIGVYYRAAEIMSDKLMQYELKEADIVLSPKAGNLHWTMFSEAMNLVTEGERVTRENMTDIRKAVFPGLSLRRILRATGRARKN